MNFNLPEMYQGLLRFNKHILNELAEGLKHIPSTSNKNEGDVLVINKDKEPEWSSIPFIPTFENAAYGIEWTKNDNDVIRIGNEKFHRDLPIQNRLRGCVYIENKISYFLNPEGWAKPLENGFVPPLDGSDGDVGVSIPQFYVCVKDTGTKYQLWISDFNIDGTFTRIHPFIISHTKTMTRTREDGKEEVFSACIKKDDTRYLGGDKSSYVDASTLYGRPRSSISYLQAIEFCENRGTWVNIIDYLEWCAIQALYYIEYANFNSRLAVNADLTSDGFKQGGLGPGVTNIYWEQWYETRCNPIVETYWSSENNIGNESTKVNLSYNMGNFIYPAVYRGILNIFGDISSHIRDVVASENDDQVYLLKKGVKYSDVTADNITEKCHFIGHRANTNNYITEWDFGYGPYFIPKVVGTNKKSDYNKFFNHDDIKFKTILVGGGASDNEGGGIGFFYLVMASTPYQGVGFFTTVKLD